MACGDDDPVHARHPADQRQTVRRHGSGSNGRIGDPRPVETPKPRTCGPDEIRHPAVEVVAHRAELDDAYEPGVVTHRGDPDMRVAQSQHVSGYMVRTDAQAVPQPGVTIPRSPTDPRSGSDHAPQASTA